MTIQSLSVSLQFSGTCQKDSSISGPFVQDAHLPGHLGMTGRSGDLRRGVRDTQV